jgi:hypothetical protein
MCVVDAVAIEWALSTLRAEVVEPVRARPWSDVGRIRAGGAVWWLKISKGGTRYEPQLLRVLAGTGSPLLPEVIIHPTQPWVLIRNAGRRLADLELSPAELIDLWCRVVIEYARLQRAVPTAGLVQAGVPDFRPSTLPEAYEALFGERQWYAGLVTPDLTRGELQRARRFLPRLERMAADLDEGPAVTIQHDDVHETNVVLDSRLDRPRLIDWGDAVVSHPFCSMGVTLDRLSGHLGWPVEHPMIMRVADAYLKPWRADGWSEPALLLLL